VSRLRRVRVSVGDEQPWQVPAPDTNLDNLQMGDMMQAAPDDDGPVSRFHHPGSDEELQLFEVRLPPGTVQEAHSHTSDEIIVVMDGSLILGARTCHPGTSIYVPGGTLYGFRAGPDGLRFLNFRPRQDLTYFTKDRHLARRSANQRGSRDGSAAATS